MNPSPLVTIVTPSFNHAKFISETIESVIHQSYQNIEYIVFDGGSTDGTVDIISSYSDRLTYWKSEKDRGQSHAINKGWRRGKGDIFCYLNSDDVLEADAVANVIDIFLKYPETGIVYGDSIIMNEDDTKRVFSKKKQLTYRQLLRDGQEPYVSQPASFYNAHLVRELGYINETLHYSMDYDLLLRLAAHSKSIYLPKCLARTREHSGAKSSAGVNAHWKESLRVTYKYGKQYLLWKLAKYCRYRLFQLLPAPVRNLLRRLRTSGKDISSLHL